MSLSKLSDLGIGIIQCKQSGKNDEIIKLQYKANDILFKYSNTYISPVELKNDIDTLINIGIELKNVNVSDTSPKETILRQIRDIVTKMRKYIQQYIYDENDAVIVQKMINYTVTHYLKNKKEDTLTVKKIIKYLDDWKRLHTQFIIPYNIKVKTTTFNTMRDELISILTQIYTI